MRWGWSHRVGPMLGIGWLLLALAVLAGCGLYTPFTYRSLVRALSSRAAELPLAAELSREVGELRITLGELQGLRARWLSSPEPEDVYVHVRRVRDLFNEGLADIEDTLACYRRQLEFKLPSGSGIDNLQPERETIHEIEAALKRVHGANRDESWMFDAVKVDQLDAEVEHLQQLAIELPSHLHRRLATLR